MLGRFHTIPERDEQTDRRTGGRTDRIATSISRVSLVMRDKNRDFRPIYRFMSETIHDGAIVSMECEGRPYSDFQVVPFSMTLSDL